MSDSSGGKLPGVTVNARNQENGASRETVTDALGTYSFSALPPGTYTVSAALPGFGIAERKDVKLPIASQVTIPFVLQIASLTETVNVTEQAPLVDTTEHVVKTLIDSQRIESLPLKTRDFLDLTMLAPGVVTDQSSASAGQTDSISFGLMSARRLTMASWLLVVTPRADCRPQCDDLLKFLAERFPRWMLPDDVVVLHELPHTATGKVMKIRLREMFRNHPLPER